MLQDYERYEEAATAIEPLAEAMEKNPDVARAYGNAQSELAQQNHYMPEGAAIAARLHFMRACHFEQEHDFKHQREELLQAIEHDETDADVLIAMYRLADADDAWMADTRAWINKLSRKVEEQIADNPNNPIPYNQWAWLIANTEGDFAKAVRYSRRSLELEPDTSSFLDTLGRCYYSAGEYEKAVESERKAVALIPHMQVMQRQLKEFEKTLAEKKQEAEGGEQEAGKWINDSLLIRFSQAACGLAATQCWYFLTLPQPRPRHEVRPALLDKDRLRRRRSRSANPPGPRLSARPYDVGRPDRGPGPASPRDRADLRGFGQTPLAEGDTERGIGMEAYADDLAELLDVLAVREPIVLAGFSMGGYVAWQFVRKYGSRLRALIQCDTRAQADTDEARAGRLKVARHVAEWGSDRVAEMMGPNLFAPVTFEKQPAVVAAVREVVSRTQPTAIAAAQRGMAARPDVTDICPRSTCRRWSWSANSTRSARRPR